VISFLTIRAPVLAGPIVAAVVWGGGGGGASGALHPTQIDGRELAAELGCGACHAGLPAPDRARARAPAFGPVAPPIPTDFVFAYLAAPERRRDNIGLTRMPDFGFDEAERVALALFLGTGPPSGAAAEASARHPAADGELGERLFALLGCSGCHSGVGGAAPSGVGPDLSREGVRARPEWLRAFLRAPTPIRRDGYPGAPGARMPDFRLSDEEAEALGTFLVGLGSRFAALDTVSLTPFQTLRTRRLLEDRLACLGCHEVGGEGGRIGPPLDGIGERREESFVLEMILDPSQAVPGSPMPRQAMPERDARRLARYLLTSDRLQAPRARVSLASASHPASLVEAPDGTSEGAALYARHCASCHGPRGRGDGWNASRLPVPPTAHADSALMAGRADDTLFDAISGGAWVLDGSPRMPPFGHLLSAGQIRALVSYIRELCTCEGPDWSRDREEGAATS
jgi:nitric oxide reductase subunit C